MQETTAKLEAECFSVAKKYIGLKSCTSNSETDSGRKPCNVSKDNRNLLASRIWNAVQLLWHLGWFSASILAILYVNGTTQVYKRFDRYLFDKVGEFHIPTVKISRLVSMTFLLYNLPQFQDAHTKDCFLVNPFFEMQTNTPPCSLCHNVTEIADFSGISNHTFHQKYHHNGIPFVIKNTLTEAIKIDNLTEFLGEKNINFNGNYSHNEFKITDMKASLALRKQFPIPYFVPYQSEVDLQQYIFLDGPSSKSYQLPFTTFGNVVLTQGRGRRLITLIPTWRCKPTCPSLSIVLETGHALYYSLYFWRAFSQPAPDQPEQTERLSVINISSFYL